MPPVPALSNQFQKATGRALAVAQARLVAIAKDRHGRIMNRDPHPAGFTRFVDGHMGVLETAVRAAGVIHYIYHRPQIGFERDIKDTIARLDEIATFALDELRRTSPVGTGGDSHPGLYRDSHKLFLNGYPVADLSRWKEGDEISITNYVEYSRILEVGAGKFRLPNYIYENASDVVAEKYGQDANIEFTWRGITDAMQIAQDPRQRKGFGTRVAGARRSHNISAHRFPTIVIRPHPTSRLGQIANIAGNALSIADSAMQIGAALSVGVSAPQSVPMLNAPGTIDN